MKLVLILSILILSFSNSFSNNCEKNENKTFLKDSSIVKHAKTFFYGEPPKDIDNPEFQCLNISENGIIVKYREKYGPETTVECVGLWYSKVQNKYRLTWKDSKFILIEVSNNTQIEVFYK